jgi:hypothetical protein
MHLTRNPIFATFAPNTFSAAPSRTKHTTLTIQYIYHDDAVPHDAARPCTKSETQVPPELPPSLPAHANDEQTEGRAIASFRITPESRTMRIKPSSFFFNG